MQILSNTLANLDITLLRLIHHHRIVAFDQLLYLISFSSSFISIGLVLTILVISLKKKSKSSRFVFYKMLAVLIIAAVVSFTLKQLITRERPFKTYPDIEKMSEAGNSSFPSGHTLEVFAIAVSFSVAFPKRKYIIPLFIWAALVAYSRMALGVHYPSDVICGMIIGALIGWLVPKVIKRRSGDAGMQG
jgi:membrane-associated phospholipid phosphatase